MSTKNFTTSVLAERSHLVYRVNGEKDGQRYWAYALIDNGKIDAFHKAIDSGDIYVQSYGKILAWGQGDTRPDRVKQDIKTMYGFDLIA